ncbi:MAG: fatty acid desaturase [Methylococcales bacterium]
MEYLKYLLSLFFPLCVAGYLYTAPHNILSALAWTIPLWSLILFDYLSPIIDPYRHKIAEERRFYDLLLYTLSFLQMVIISLLLIDASQLQWHSIQEVTTSVVNLSVMRILVGTSSGSSAIIVAHELIHRPLIAQRILGQLLLYTVCYDHFRVAHLYGHHLRVATPEDIATARLGESFKAYWQRVTIKHFKFAWNDELQRLDLLNTPIYHYKILANSVLQGIIVECVILVLIIIFFGWVAVVIFLYQAYSAVRLLETINYYQHWGLQQGKSQNNLAWVNTSQVSEYALLGLSNHIEHHKNAKTPFYQTNYSNSGPIMKYGYFVTNLWVKLNNASYRKDCTDRLKKI